jgi:hypothetical protein
MSWISLLKLALELALELVDISGDRPTSYDACVSSFLRSTALGKRKRRKKKKKKLYSQLCVSASLACSSR